MKKNETRDNVFINFSNHPSSNWSENQKKAVYDQYQAQIIDIPFPQVSAFADEGEIRSLAEQCVETICNHNPKAVMCQGEFGLTYQVITLLKRKGILTVYSCSERRLILALLKPRSFVLCVLENIEPEHSFTKIEYSY